MTKPAPVPGAVARRLPAFTEQARVAGFDLALTIAVADPDGRVVEIQLNRAGRAGGQQLDLLLDELGLRLSRALQGRRASTGAGRRGRQQRLKLTPIAGMRGWLRAPLGSVRLPSPLTGAPPTRLRLDLVVAPDAGGRWRDLRLMTNGDADPGLRRVVGELAPVLVQALRQVEAAVGAAASPAAIDAAERGSAGGVQ